MTDKILAYHFDLKRPMWKREYMEEMVKRLAGWGFNTILYEIEDKFRFTKHPAIAHPDALSADETASFVKFCRANNMDVIPMMQSLGHSECVLSKPEYAHLRETPENVSLYDPLSTEATTLICELFDEIVDVFEPEGYFHMGGDETGGLGSSEGGKAVVEEIGVGGLYLKHMAPIFEHLRKKGIRPMIWADIVLAHADVLDQIPKDVVLVDWNYTVISERCEKIWVLAAKKCSCTYDEFQALEDSPAKQFVEKYGVDDQSREDKTFRRFYQVEALADMGLDVITASANRCAGDTAAVPRAHHCQNVFASTRKGCDLGLGHVVTSWTTRYNHQELTMSAAFAAPYALQHEGELDRDALTRAYTKDVFGVEMPEFDQALELACELVPFSQSKVINKMARTLKKGEDPIAQFLETSDDLQSTIDDTESKRKGFAEARRILEELQNRAQKNADIFDYWFEGVDLIIFYADFALAVMNGTLKEQSQALMQRLQTMREATRNLFSTTYLPTGVEAELDLRYGLHESYLSR